MSIFLGRKNWASEATERHDCSTVSEVLPALTERIFTEADVPRFLTANTTGTIVIEDWDTPANIITRNVVAGQPVFNIPKRITDAGTAEVILEY